MIISYRVCSSRYRMNNGTDSATGSTAEDVQCRVLHNIRGGGCWWNTVEADTQSIVYCDVTFD